MVSNLGIRPASVSDATTIAEFISSVALHSLGEDAAAFMRTISISGIDPVAESAILICAWVGRQ